MQPNDEYRDLGEAASMLVGRVVEPVEGMHRTITERGFRYVGPLGEPVRLVHNAVVDRVYSAVRWTAGAIGAGAGAVLAARSTPPPSETRRGSGIQAALNGVWGDRLDERGNALSVSLALRSGDVAVPIDTAALVAAYPAASSHIVMLLHGFGQTERCWDASSDGDPSLFEALEAAPGITPVLVRYNSGLPIARTGADLAQLLEELEAAWPVDAPTISLVGYSMGGLIARSAYASGMAVGHEWATGARHLVSIGTPHTGTPIARSVGLGKWALRIARTTRPLGDFLDGASAGIKDLQGGADVAAAWQEAVPIPEGHLPAIRQHFVAAVVTESERHPVGALVGDLIVPVASATQPAAPSENVRIVAKRRHFDLLADPDITGQVVDWLHSD
ncbi:MAG: alpha/beta fold hydrolase [bacterium]|nr:alpha/beta fold hydrolase [bacterium]